MKGSLRLFDVAWRLAIVLLPWQTRWFYEGPLLGSYPWEGGRWSIYLSWLPLIATLILGSQKDASRARTVIKNAYLFLIPALSILLSTYRPATTQWWGEIILLGMFVWTLIRQVSRDDLTRWIMYAIVPHALLGVVQYSTQLVVGSKWLGIASQNPLTPGVSVIAREGVRTLRAYGGFPHPNIFGGWLVLGLVSALHQVKSRMTYPAAALFAGSLVLSFSRSAWLAAVLVGGFACYRIFRSGKTRTRSPYLGVIFSILCGSAIAAVFSLPLIRTRTASNTPLEVRSLSEREQGFRNGLELIKRHPWIGSGPRTISLALKEEGIIPSSVIPVPPHNAFLLMIAEVGVIGMSLIALYMARFSRHASTEAREMVFLALCFSPIAFLDHYLWSTWSGLALVALLGAVGAGRVMPDTADEAK